MTSRTALLAVAALVAAGPTGAVPADFPANRDFEDGATGWTLPEGAAVQPADGADDSALSLSGGWAVSGPSAEDLSGWQQVSLHARATDSHDGDRLLLALLGPDEAPAAQAAIPVSAVGSDEREIAAELPASPGPVRLAIGASGATAWSIDDIQVQAIERPSSPEADADSPPSLEPPLPADWEPDGLIDAFERPLGTGSELLVNVGALEVGLSPRVTARRGHRGTLRLTVSNRAMAARDLTVSVAGPPGLFAPRRTVSIRASGDTVFDSSLQAFFVGTRRVRVNFSSQGEEASVPVSLEVTPSYPAAGVAFTGARPSDEDLAVISDLDLQLVATRLSSGAADGPAPLPAHLTRLLLLGPPWSHDSVQSTAGTLAGQAAFMALHHERDEASPEHARALIFNLRDALEDAPEPVYLLSPPLDLHSGSPLSIDDGDLAVAAELGAAGAIAAPVLRLPVTHARAVGAVTVNGRPVAAPQPAWQSLSSDLSFGEVIGTLRQTARLPMFFADIAGRSAGSPTADAMALARLLTLCVYQGATGFTLTARPADAPEGADAFCPIDSGGPRPVVADTIRELSRELAAAIPLKTLKQSDEIGLGDDVAVGFRPFMRGDEGMLALWNNTSAPVDLIVETRTQPLDVHTVSVGLGGVRRSYQGAFHFSDEAIALNRPVMFVTLAPHEFRWISMQLARPHAAWLAAVERKPKIPDTENRRRHFFEKWEERGLNR